MADSFTIKAGNTSPSIARLLTDSAGAAVDITGATIRFHMFTRKGVSVVDAAATLVDALTGSVRYDWIAADTAAAGWYDGEFEVIYSDATIETFPNSAYILINIPAVLA